MAERLFSKRGLRVVLGPWRSFCVGGAHPFFFLMLAFLLFFSSSRTVLGFFCGPIRERGNVAPDGTLARQAVFPDPAWPWPAHHVAQSRPPQVCGAH